jgi:hypothetical protein
LIDSTNENNNIHDCFEKSDDYEPYDHSNHNENDNEEENHLVVLPAKMQLGFASRLAKHVCLRAHFLGLDGHLSEASHTR